MPRAATSSVRFQRTIRPVIKHQLSCSLPNPLPRASKASYISNYNIYNSRRAMSQVTMSVPGAPLAGDQPKPPQPGVEVRADSGLIYKIEAVLKENLRPLFYVCRATAQGKNYIIKFVPGDFDYQLDLQKDIAASPNIRTLVDTVRLSELLIFPFLASDLLQFRQHQGLTLEQQKDILKQALCGLADLHGNNILHNDVKPNNILVDYEEAVGDQPLTIKAVQIADLDDAVIVPPGKYLRGPLCGNQFWRSPESWARSAQNQASDVFSLGIVAIYIMLNDMVFFLGEDELSSQDPWRPILSRHISLFGDEDGLRDLLEHLGEENPFTERIIELASGFSKANPRKPFAKRHGVDIKFRDLVGKMTNLAPAARITARQALEHEWFKSQRGAVAPPAELEEARAALGRGSQPRN